jgi:plastocyanin
MRIRPHWSASAFGPVLYFVVFVAFGNETDFTLFDKDGRPVANAVVFVNAEESAEKPTRQKAVVDQINKKFVPSVMVIQAGTEVEFPNSDSTSHHVYSFSRPNEFELPLYKSGTKPKVRFEQPGVVTLGCNIHDSMIGYIVVTGSSNFTVTDEFGRGTMPRDSASEQLLAWSPRIGATEPVPVARESSGRYLIDVGLRPDPEPASGSLAWEDY